MRKRLAIRFLLFAAVGAGIVVALLNREHLSPGQLEAAIARLGVWGPLAYIAAWLIAPVLFLPGAPLTLAGGALFGLFWGSLYTLAGATGGATLAFLVSRYLAADWVERKAGARLGRIRAGVEREGWIYLAFTRLVPLFPFNLLNYAFGLTRIPLRTYVLTSLVCMAPGTAGYIYLGSFSKDALLGGEDLVRKGLIALGVFAALVFVPILIRRWRARRALRAGGGDDSAEAPGRRARAGPGFPFSAGPGCKGSARKV